MRCHWTMILVVSAVVTLASAEQTPLIGVLPNLRRQFVSCEETYGDDWITCGDERSRFCYSPALGQSCCETDNGYCEAGSRCAPISGQCCADGEDLATCAQTAGFELPANAMFGEPVTPGATFRVFNAGFNESSPNTTSSSTGTGASNAVGSSGPYVQVSVGGKRHGTLFWMATAMGAVGLFMLSC